MNFIRLESTLRWNMRCASKTENFRFSQNGVAMPVALEHGFKEYELRTSYPASYR